MVEFERAMERGREGIMGCVKAAADVDNAPTYAGVGVGLIGGNIVAKEIEKLYIGSTTAPNMHLQFLARSAGRLLTSAVVCALSGSVTNMQAREFLEKLAIGSSGMILVDGIKTYAPAPYGDYADLEMRARRITGPTMIRSPVVSQPRVIRSPEIVRQPPTRIGSLQDSAARRIGSLDSVSRRA